ncbi:hypothetical protein [Streptomyces sp. RB17]|uniref:hypothetical protein n=1 Tax=Streptomyces sp. RB17 TaxID=2585197 RepID=UPI0012977BDC|nr:hypothetical protein [Streptomyces sp. RB17]
MATILKWVERNTLTMEAWEDAAKVDEVLRAVGSKSDGTRAAASSVKRNRRILNVAMDYAVKHRILRANPLPKEGGAAPKTSSAVDKRSLLNPEQAARLLGWVRRRPRSGDRLHAFFATMHYAGSRPGGGCGDGRCGRPPACGGRRRPVVRVAVPHRSAGGLEELDG